MSARYKFGTSLMAFSLIAPIAQAQWVANWNTREALTNWPSTSYTYYVWQDSSWASQLWHAVEERIGAPADAAHYTNYYWDTLNYISASNLYVSGLLKDRVFESIVENDDGQTMWVNLDYADMIVNSNDIPFNIETNADGSFMYPDLIQFGKTEQYEDELDYKESLRRLGIISNYFEVHGTEFPWVSSGIPYYDDNLLDSFGIGTFYSNGVLTYCASLAAAMWPTITNDYTQGHYLVGAFGYPPLYWILTNCMARAELTPAGGPVWSSVQYQKKEYDSGWTDPNGNWDTVKSEAESDLNSSITTSAWTDGVIEPTAQSCGLAEANPGTNYKARLSKTLVRYRVDPAHHSNETMHLKILVDGDDEFYTGGDNVWNDNGLNMVQGEWTLLVSESEASPETAWIGVAGNPAWCDKPSREDTDHTVTEGCAADDETWVLEYDDTFDFDQEPP